MKTTVCMVVCSIIMLGIPLEKWDSLPSVEKREVLKQTIKQIRKESPCGKETVIQLTIVSRFLIVNGTCEEIWNMPKYPVTSKEEKDIASNEKRVIQ